MGKSSTSSKVQHVILNNFVNLRSNFLESNFICKHYSLEFIFCQCTKRKGLSISLLSVSLNDQSTLKVTQSIQMISLKKCQTQSKLKCRCNSFTSPQHIGFVMLYRIIVITWLLLILQI